MNAVGPAAANDKTVALELVEGTRHGLPSRPGHLPEQFVGQRKVQPNCLGTDATMRARELHERLANSIDMVEPRQIGDRGVLLSQGLGETIQQRGGRLRRLEETLTLPVGDEVKGHVRERDEHLIRPRGKDECTRAGVARDRAARRARHSAAEHDESFLDGDELDLREVTGTKRRACGENAAGTASHKVEKIQGSRNTRPSPGRFGLEVGLLRDDVLERAPADEHEDGVVEREKPDVAA